MLGLNYKEGLLNLDYDGSLAKEWYFKSAKQGNPLGMLGHGLCCIGEEREVWLKKAFEANDIYVKGRCYFSGYFVEKDRNEAFTCFMKCADEGNMLAKYYGGYCFRNGNGVNVIRKLGLNGT